MVNICQIYDHCDGDVDDIDTLFFFFNVAKKAIHQKNGQWSVCLILA